MSPRRALLLPLLLAACATPPAPAGLQVSEARIQQSVVPGRTTKAELIAALGPTTHIAFDSGYEVWLYRVADGPGRETEVVILLDARGVVKKLRRRAPPPMPRAPY